MIREIAAVLDELGEDPSSLAAEIVRLRRALGDAAFEASRSAASNPAMVGGAVLPSVGLPADDDRPRRRIGYLP